MTAQSRTRHPLEDDTQLTKSDLNVLRELCEPSWNNEFIPWGSAETMAGFPNKEPEFSAEVARLEEFARDVEEATAQDEPNQPFLPFWDSGNLHAEASIRFATASLCLV